MSVTNTTEIREVLREQAQLSVDVDAIDEHDDLFQAGMSSAASVNVMLALEDHFDVEFQDEMLNRATFESIAAIHSAVSQLRDG